MHTTVICKHANVCLAGWGAAKHAGVERGRVGGVGGVGGVALQTGDQPAVAAGGTEQQEPDRHHHH